MLRFVYGSIFGRVAAGVVVVLALLVGYWFFWIRETHEVQKAAAEVNDAVRQAANATATPGTPAATGTQQGTTTAQPATVSSSSINATSYTIVQGQSSAWYLANEKLASLPTSSVAKGTTTDVKGEFHFASDGLDPAKPTTFTVGVASLKSDESRRDQRARDALETSKYPTATFTATRLTGMPQQFSATDSVMQLTGTLEVHGVKKEVTWELKVKQSGDILSGLGTVKFKFSDFGIRKPDIGGFVTVEEEVTIQVQLFAKQS